MIDGELIQRCIDAILTACPRGSRVMLFGSQARGDARTESDVDFLVIEPEVGARVAEAARLARVIRPLRVPADIVVVDEATFQAWKDTPSSIFYEAARHGKAFI